MKNNKIELILKNNLNKKGFEELNYLHPLYKEEIALINEFYHYISSNTCKYDKLEVGLLCICIFIISRIINKPIFKILEDLKII